MLCSRCGSLCCENRRQRQGRQFGMKSAFAILELAIVRLSNLAAGANRGSSAARRVDGQGHQNRRENRYASSWEMSSPCTSVSRRFYAVVVKLSFRGRDRECSGRGVQIVAIRGVLGALKPSSSVAP